VRHVLEEIAYLESLKHVGSAANLAADFSRRSLFTSKYFRSRAKHS
jgi:hypothetical protein